MIVTSSRDKSINLWNLTKEDRTYGVACRQLTGHSHFVQEVVLSSDGMFAFSGTFSLVSVMLYSRLTSEARTTRGVYGRSVDSGWVFSVVNRKVFPFTPQYIIPAKG
ncbi:unnamed protein product [Fraxinus pennsylvanica]|uniref:Uncharacterized protein n=1 Tax=Fraxinus pennsylvanica TaxID=56036 RepID=A0AAD1ZCF4_9LAMI|nr:unnamed protein product [Fraxinus pennsylvanica]